MPTTTVSAVDRHGQPKPVVRRGVGGRQLRNFLDIVGLEPPPIRARRLRRGEAQQTRDNAPHLCNWAARWAAFKPVDPDRKIASVLQCASSAFQARL